MAGFTASESKSGEPGGRVQLLPDEYVVRTCIAKIWISIGIEWISGFDESLQMNQNIKLIDDRHHWFKHEAKNFELNLFQPKMRVIFYSW